MSSPSHVIGIDIGGTNLKAGLLTENGQLLATEKYLLEESDKTEAGILDATEAIVSNILKSNDVSLDGLIGVGLGIAGVIDTAQGIITESPNFPKWHDFEFSKRLSERLQRPVAIENDVNAIARGEAWQGACRNERHFFAMALGTGLGGAVFLNGDLWNGVDGMAGEIGHINVFPEGEPCGCGSRGCLETIASSTGLLRRAKAESFSEALERAGHESRLAATLAEMAKEGHSKAQQYWDDLGQALGIVSAGLLNTLNVKVILVAGGIARALEHFRPQMEKNIRDYAFTAVAKDVEIRPCILWEEGGMVGAAANLLSRTGRL